LFILDAPPNEPELEHNDAPFSLANDTVDALEEDLNEKESER
jgi:hypothetical protein